MEKKIKALYTLSIIAILAFLGMQGYWLYTRYEYSLREYEDRIEESISKILVEYRTLRTENNPVKYDETTVQSSYNMNTDVDSIGKVTRKVTVTTKIFNGRALLGITEKRDLTLEEKIRLQKFITDSLTEIEQKIATFDVSSAPSDAFAWSAMKNFELEVKSPFTDEGIDSLLTKESINAEISLIQTDSLIWNPILTRHNSVLHPRFKITSPYSELDRKAVVIDCEIPISSIIKGMGWTLVLASILSALLILCLVCQIKTIVKLSRLDKMRNSFITTMIHELKRPISTLKMCVSGVENEKILSDKEIKAELMSSARNALDNLSAYFSKLRDITFNNLEQIPLNITKFNLSKLVNDVLSSAAIPSSKAVKFENKTDSSLEVSADRSHIFNVINNLVENAIKYSGDTVDITIASMTDNSSFSIVISDNGNGISGSDLRHIFTRFYRGRASASDIPGMGLGLAYVKLLVEAHGGNVTVDSKPSEGSSFTINLPQ